MKRLAVLFLALGLFAGPAAAAKTIIEFKVQYFAPRDALFRDVYGGGWMYGGEGTVRIGKHLGAWLGGSVLSKRGELTYTREETKLEIFPVGAGLKGLISAGRADFYAGAGVVYFHFSERNPIGRVDKANLGYTLKAGTFLRLGDGLILDLYADFTDCRMRPAGVKFNVGGFNAGLGLGFEF